MHSQKSVKSQIMCCSLLLVFKNIQEKFIVIVQRLVPNRKKTMCRTFSQNNKTQSYSFLTMLQTFCTYKSYRCFSCFWAAITFPSFQYTVKAYVELVTCLSKLIHQLYIMLSLFVSLHCKRTHLKSL